MDLIKSKEKISTNKGFTLLFASLIAALLLAIGTGIFNIVFKELILTSSAKGSQFAFYSADSGIECALFADLRKRSFATSTGSAPPPSETMCAGQNISSGWNVVTGANSAVTTFELTFPPSQQCATVTVIKGGGDTTIEARGYNTCDTSNPRRMERGISVKY
jgi:hypothetical protein